MFSAMEAMEDPAALAGTATAVRVSLRDAACVVAVAAAGAAAVTVSTGSGSGSGAGASAVAATSSEAVHAMSGTVTVVGSVEIFAVGDCWAASESATGAALAAADTAAVRARPVTETTAVPRIGLMEREERVSVTGASGRRALRCRAAVLAVVTSGAFSLFNLRGQLSDSGRRARSGLPDFTPRP